MDENGSVAPQVKVNETIYGQFVGFIIEEFDNSHFLISQSQYTEIMPIPGKGNFYEIAIFHREDHYWHKKVQNIDVFKSLKNIGPGKPVIVRTKTGPGFMEIKVEEGECIADDWFADLLRERPGSVSHLMDTISDNIKQYKREKNINEILDD